MRHLEYDEYHCTQKGAVTNELANEDVRPGRKFAVCTPSKDINCKITNCKITHRLFARCFRKR